MGLLQCACACEHALRLWPAPTMVVRRLIVRLQASGLFAAFGRCVWFIPGGIPYTALLCVVGEGLLARRRVRGFVPRALHCSGVGSCSLLSPRSLPYVLPL